MNNAKSFLPTPIIFAIGAAVGLAFGLWIGWGLWPVEWQGGTLRDLDEAGKAEYIAAVADAFVIYDTPEAAANAQHRLAALEEDLNTEFVNAIRYFQSSSQPERTIRVSNIGRLANSLGLVPPDLQAGADTTSNEGAANVVNQATQENAAGSTTAESSQPASVATATETNNRLSWFRWFLWLLAALFLVSGALYLMAAAGLLNIQQIMTYFKTITQRGTGVDEFVPEDYPHNPSRRPSQRTNATVTHATSTEDLTFDHDDGGDDHWQYDPTNTPRNQWQADDDWQQPATARFANDYRAEGDVYATNERENLYEGTFAYAEEDVDDGREESDDAWDDSAFEEESPDAYDRFRPGEDDANPVHYRLDTLEESGSIRPGEPIDQLDREEPDEPKVQTVNDLMAAGSRLRTEVSNSLDEDHDLEDDDLEDDEYEDDEFADNFAGNANRYSVEWEDDPQQILGTRPMDEEIDEEDQETDLRSQHGIASGPTHTTFRREDLAEVDLEQFQHRRPASPPPSSPTAGEHRRPERTQPQQRENRHIGVSTPGKRPRHQLIDQHTLTYQMGMAEYDESKPIVDPDIDRYIGEFGMGTSEKNGVVQPNSNYVAALEVWLFDKSDEKHMGNQTRILLSEYAIDHNLEQALTKERTDNPRSFTPQPGVHFQLESQNLLLDCTIVDVKYIESGPGKGMFGSVRVDMSVHKKA